MLFRLEREAVHVDTHRRDVGVVLVRLDPVEVVTVTHREAVVAVQLEECSDGRVLARHALHAGHRVTALEHAAVPPVGVVERLLALPGVDDVVIAADEAVALDHPHELLARVVEVQLQLVRAGGDGLTASELEHIDQVLVADLGELAALVSVEVDVVDVQGGSRQTALANAVADGVGVRAVGVVPAEVVQGVELQVDAHLVVLEGDQGQGQTRVAAEPELQGDVQGVHGGAAGDDLRGQGLATVAVVVASAAALVEQVGQLRHVTNHLGVAGLLARLLGELIPDVQPLAVLLVDALATDFDLHILDDVVADPVEPAELGTRAVAGLELHLGQSRLEVHAVDQITVALDSAGDLLAEVRSTVERVLDGLHGEVSVAAVNHLEESNLRVTSEVDVLGAIGYELH